ncbi:SUZ domain-containing protein isoform 3 [Schistosoma japonicum]|uniref:SUZ domain-containing protein isoform 3 n=3 Tax=Schistosoma japonicum TaxID=6182 RepID=A0A4Z2CTV9_SCHJA|nr:SUZ domain-containing protein isoform 3 [Schistosoma japonicum]TNN07728.1 SUZ domain-containing protein isoform 3 [Schistosoma japonicum]
MEHPPIRILRRPCPVPSDVPKTTQRPPVVTKTLEQREADYAAARKRIMGSATPEQENMETKEVSEFNSLNMTEDISNATTKRNSFIGTASMTQNMDVCIQNNAVEMTSNHLCTNQSGVQHSVPQSNKQHLDIGVNRKPQQHSQCTTNGVRQNLQQRSPTVTANRLSYIPQPPLFSFQTGYNNVGLLPTPPGFQCSPSNETSASLQQTTAIALMHQFSLLQQQYQHTLNGIQNKLVSSGSHSSNSFSPLNFSSFSQSNINHKYTHPSTFN